MRMNALHISQVGPGELPAGVSRQIVSPDVAHIDPTDWPDRAGPVHCSICRHRVEWYVQVSGTAMGKKYAPNYNNTFMLNIVYEIMEKASKNKD